MRINVIDPVHLSDVHLRAEYREILMSPHYFNVSAKSSKGINLNQIPPFYTLNKGHAYFWYDKYLYILQRHDLLEQEMIRRKFKIRDTNKIIPLIESFVPNSYVKDWIPDMESVYVNIERIIRRIYEMIYVKDKPNFYKYCGLDRDFDGWVNYYIRVLNLSTHQVEDMIRLIRKDNGH